MIKQKIQRQKQVCYGTSSKFKRDQSYLRALHIIPEY